MPRRFLVLAACVIAAVSVATAQPPSYDRFFTAQTMRVDYFHTGGPGGEALVLDRVVSEGAWPGSRSRLIDDTNLGTYFFEGADLDTNEARYSRGFASMYGEWATTADIRSLTRTFHESLRFPWPRAPVRISVKKRDAENVFRDVWSTDVDPKSPAVDRRKHQPVGRVWTVFEN